MKLTEDEKKAIQEKFREVMYRSGLALHSASQLERSFKLLMFVLSEQRFADMPVERARELIEDRKTQPLSQILDRIAQHVEFSPEDRETLRTALVKRNWFIHSFFWDRGEAISQDATRPEVVRELKELNRQFGKAAQKTDAVTDLLFRQFYGTSMDSMKEDAIRRVMQKPNNGADPIG